MGSWLTGGIAEAIIDSPGPGEYIIRYDSGDHFGTIREIEVTKEEAMQAQESDEAAERIIIHHQNIELFGEDYMNR